MSNEFRKAFLFAAVYSVVCIAFKIYIIQSGLILTSFGFYYSHAITVLFMVPFMFAALFLYRNKFYGGKISGREGFKFLMAVLLFSVILMSAYHYAEFEWKLLRLAKEYYNGPLFLEFLKKQNKIKAEEYPKIIEEQLNALSAFKAVTSKLVSYLVIGTGSAFFSALILKKA
jgi:hypothetical protein